MELPVNFDNSIKYHLRLFASHVICRFCVIDKTINKSFSSVMQHVPLALSQRVCIIFMSGDSETSDCCERGRAGTGYCLSAKLTSVRPSALLPARMAGPGF